MINVYWAPSSFQIENESWNMHYADPVSVTQDVFQQNVNNRDFLTCPALRDSVKNLYSFNAAIEEYTDLDPSQLAFLHDNEDLLIPLETTLSIPLIRRRKNSLKNHINLLYPMSWILFADKPLEASFLAPYIPPTTPTPQAILATGKFNIGKWFRSYNLEYFTPITATSFQYRQNDPLFYLQLHTNEKIKLHRFNMTNKLAALEQENIQSVHRYGFGKTLQQRYQMFNTGRLRNMILKEIKNNLI